MNQETSYRVLGVNSYSTFPEIKKKYRELIKIKHPDHGGNSDDFILVQEAYKFLEKNHNKLKFPFLFICIFREKDKILFISQKAFTNSMIWLDCFWVRKERFIFKRECSYLCDSLCGMALLL